ncbi:uncharacterized protein LOC144625484 [Crassostrea virginica]
MDERLLTSNGIFADHDVIDVTEYSGQNGRKETENTMQMCQTNQSSSSLRPETGQGHFNLPSADSDRCLVALSIFSVICFCPVGILAVITVSKLQQAKKDGREHLVESLSGRTRQLVSLSLGLGIVATVFCAIVYFVNIFGIRTYFT